MVKSTWSARSTLPQCVRSCRAAAALGSLETKASGEFSARMSCVSPTLEPTRFFNEQSTDPGEKGTASGSEVQVPLARAFRLCG
jgi:hypothetical protein